MQADRWGKRAGWAEAGVIFTGLATIKALLDTIEAKATHQRMYPIAIYKIGLTFSWIHTVVRAA